MYNKKGSFNELVTPLIVVVTFMLVLVFGVLIATTFRTAFLALSVSSVESTNMINSFTDNFSTAGDYGLLFLLVMLYILTLYKAKETQVTLTFLPIAVMISIFLSLLVGILQYIVENIFADTVLLAVMAILPITSFIAGKIIYISVLWSLSLMVALFWNK